MYIATSFNNQTLNAISNIIALSGVENVPVFCSIITEKLNITSVSANLPIIGKFLTESNVFTRSVKNPITKSHIVVSSWAKAIVKTNSIMNGRTYFLSINLYFRLVLFK